MKIKKGDKVKIVKGKDNGKTGKVLQVFPTYDKVSVEGCNIAIKNMKPKRSGEKGQRIEYPRPVSIANVSLVCPKCSKETRVGYTVLENKQKVRICKKCKQAIDA